MWWDDRAEMYCVKTNVISYEKTKDFSQTVSNDIFIFIALLLYIPRKVVMNLTSACQIQCGARAVI